MNTLSHIHVLQSWGFCALYCTVRHSTVLYCTVQYCTVLYQSYMKKSQAAESAACGERQEKINTKVSEATLRDLVSPVCGILTSSNPLSMRKSNTVRLRKRRLRNIFIIKKVRLPFMKYMCVWMQLYFHQLGPSGPSWSVRFVCLQFKLIFLGLLLVNGCGEPFNWSALPRPFNHWIEASWVRLLNHMIADA